VGLWRVFFVVLSMGESIDLYLASKSPRRRELLQQIGVRFTVVSSPADETCRAAEAPEDYVRRVALDKAGSAIEMRLADPSRPVLAADTAVVLEDRIMGKPATRHEALQMLSLLSGRTHRVLSAVALIAADGVESTALSESLVRFRIISRQDAVAYWDTGEPADKAGAYGIQGLGALFVADLQGSYSGVVGLPLFETARLLEHAGIAVLNNAAARFGAG